MLPLDACAGRSDVGGKAETLARMRAAGLRAPDGVVLLADEVVDDAELAAALARLGGGPFVVRSSASLEDAVGASGAGLFLTVENVPAREVPAAIARVRASADSPAVAAYRQMRGARAPKISVLIQPRVDAEAYGVAHSAEDGFAVEERDPGVPEWGDVRARRVARDGADPLATGMRALEQIVGGPVDAELARRGDELTWLQARPLTAPIARAPAAPPFDEPGTWRLDAEHNPDPLSTAQASLVAFVDSLGVGPRQRVVERYLYVERGRPPRGVKLIAASELRRHFDEVVVPACHYALDTAEAEGSLDVAMMAYARVYRRYVGEVSPSLAQSGVRERRGGATVERDQALWELGRGRRTLEEYLARFGDHAPSWDVATPTDRERPDRVRALAAQWAAGAAPSTRAAPVAAASLASIAEDDDLLFLRAQAIVRRALVARAATLDLAQPEDVFELTLDEAASPPSDLRALVARRHAERRAAARRVPPIAYRDGAPEWPTPPERDVLRGVATRGQARGRAVVVRALADAPTVLPDDAILVAPALVPSLTPLLATARALVTDHGGALSHGATLAREYGVPAVLGVGHATSLPDGAELWVDGDAGRVYVLGRGVR